MGPIKCEIFLKKKSKIYFPSETIEGTVNICTKSATNISRMELSLIGQGKFANIPWTDDQVSVYNEIKCVQLNKILPSGTQRYPITWVLPWVLIPTCKWKSASVNYHFVAKIGVKVKGQSSAEEDFTSSIPTPVEIHNTIDLGHLGAEFKNADEHFTRLSSDSVEQPIFFRFILNRKCFIPGEHLKFNCAVTGSSVPARKVFRGTTISLDEEITYIKDAGEEKSLITNASKKTGSSATIKAFQDDGQEDSVPSCSYWEDIIKIPNFCNSTPPELDGFGVVRASYFLNVTVSLPSALSLISDARRKPQFRIPIVIGRIPLEEPLRCEIQMALLTSTRLLPWHGDDNVSIDGDERWEVVPDSDQEVELDVDPPPNLENFYTTRAETPPPTYTAAIQMTETRDSPPEYAP